MELMVQHLSRIRYPVPPLSSIRLPVPPLCSPTVVASLNYFQEQSIHHFKTSPNPIQQLSVPLLEDSIHRFQLFLCPPVVVSSQCTLQDRGSQHLHPVMPQHQAVVGVIGGHQFLHPQLGPGLMMTTITLMEGTNFCTQPME
jgi:hypothetical protein